MFLSTSVFFESAHICKDLQKVCRSAHICTDSQRSKTWEDAFDTFEQISKTGATNLGYIFSELLQTLAVLFMGPILTQWKTIYNFAFLLRNKMAPSSMFIFNLAENLPMVNIEKEITKMNVYTIW